MPTQYPAPPPSVAGNFITMEAFLQNPARVQRAIEQLTLNRFIADEIFAAGPTATGGAVLYDQLLAGAFFMDRDVQAIAPGTPFPILNDGEIMPQVAAVTKWGGSAIYTYERVRRDQRDVLRRSLVRLRNTIIRKVDTVAIAVLEAAVTAAAIPVQAGSDDWSASPDIIGDLETARSTIDNVDMGYEADTVLCHPAQALDLRKDPDIRAALPRENQATNLIGAKDLSGLLRFPNWYVSNRVQAGTVWVLQSKVVGSISDEVPLYSRSLDEQDSERYRVMAARVVVPYVTDPKACVKITGV